MCGLIAFLDYRRIPDPSAAMRRGMRALAHRGLPGRTGTLMDAERKVMLGHVRLPIVGLDERYDQPFMTDGDLSVFVGEIFGFRESGGHGRLVAPPENDAWMMHELFRGEGLKAYAGRDGFWSAVHVRGREATVVTDYLAQKPTYYHNESMVVASEPRAIIEALGIPQALDETYLSNVRKWGYDPTGRTPWADITRLPPGCAMTVALDGSGSTRVRKYYHIAGNADVDLEDRLRRAVDRRMVTDVPLAVLCSGGLDSTIVALLAAESARTGVQIFHAANDEAVYLDSIKWPESVSNVTVLPDIRFLEDDARRAYNEPVDLGSVLPQYALGRAVHAAGIRVALTGDGADELFGGYRRAKEYDSQASDIWCELPCYHLPRLDTTMMASAVELRTPYLAPGVISHALSLPWKLRTEKQALKAVARRLGVPQAIVDRPKKPLKTQQVIEGGAVLRNRLVDQFIYGDPNAMAFDTVD